MNDLIRDEVMRQAAFRLVKRRIEIREHFTAEAFRLGFDFEGQRYPLINPQRGIFKPQSMRYLLSIRTVFPRAGGRVWYDDQREAHRQIFDGDEVVDYAFMGTDAAAAENRWLHEAMVSRVPLIYFLGTAPGLYQPIIPTFIAGWDGQRLKAQLSFGLPGETRPDPVATATERRYALHQVKARLHQSTFREAVIAAYGGRCALFRFPESRLLDAAQIAADTDEEFGLPVVPNGLPLSKLHHAAFDAHMIGCSRPGAAGWHDSRLSCLRLLSGAEESVEDQSVGGGLELLPGQVRRTISPISNLLIAGLHEGVAYAEVCD